MLGDPLTAERADVEVAASKTGADGKCRRSQTCDNYRCHDQPVHRNLRLPSQFFILRAADSSLVLRFLVLGPIGEPRTKRLQLRSR